MSDRAYSIAVSGAGGGAGQSILKALQGTGYRIIGLDGEALGTGLYAVPSSYVIPYANHPAFIDRLLEICREESCELLFPGLDAELPSLGRNIARFAAVGTRVIVSNPEVIEVADNKLKTFQFLREHGISVPETIDMSAHEPGCELPLPLPFILKPRVGGARSKSVYLIKDEARFRQLEVDVSVPLRDFIAQAYVSGDEYTCGTVSIENRHIGTIVMRRILRDGDTYKCFSVKHPRIEQEVSKVINALKPTGALNIQLRLQGETPYIFELNARHSGTTYARALAGFNEPKMLADYFLKGVEPSFEIKEISVLRYWKEIVVSNDAVNEMTQLGHRVESRPAFL